MRSNLLNFLYGTDVVRQSSQKLSEQVLQLFEDASDLETEHLKIDKKPLSAALKSIGISMDVDEGPQWAEIRYDNIAEYKKHIALIFTADSMHALALKGWVPVKCGEQSMTFEPSESKIGFISIDTAETGESDKAPDLEKVQKDAQKDDTTEMDREDGLSPIETDDKSSDDNQKGVGVAKDGAKPEGKPKGSTKTNEALDRRPRNAARKQASVVNREHGDPHIRKPLPYKPQSRAESLIREMTSAAGVPAVEGPPIGVKSTIPARPTKLKKVPKQV